MQTPVMNTVKNAGKAINPVQKEEETTNTTFLIKPIQKIIKEHVADKTTC